MVRLVKPGQRHATAWLLGLLSRKPRKVVAVALANRMARIVWATLAKIPSITFDRLECQGMMTSGQAYRCNRWLAEPFVARVKERQQEDGDRSNRRARYPVASDGGVPMPQAC